MLRKKNKILEVEDTVNETSNQDNLIRVAIVEDDEEIRRGLGWELNHSAGFICAGDYGNCAELMNAIETSPPDVILMDIGLPGKSGIECVKTIKESYPRVEVLMVTVYSDEEKVFQSIRNGAVGYILKNSSTDRLLDAIREAHRGGAPMSPEVAKKVLGYFRENSDEKLTGSLSDRETEVLQCLIEGHSYKAIADKLFISVHTVRFHLHNIYEKLHVRSRAELVAKTGRSRFL